MYARILVVALIVAGMSTLDAQIPRTISFQGVLSDTTGVPRPDGTYSFTFRLYDVASGGSALWSEQKTLAVKRGLFGTSLGDQVVIGTGLKFDRPYWLGIQVAGDPELSPRVPISSTGYSFRAIRSDTALVSMTSIGDTTWRRTGDSSIYRAKGRVGIGTANPDGRLTVEGSDWGDGPMVVRGIANDNGATLDLDASNSTNGRRYSIMSTGPFATPGTGYFGVFDNSAGWRYVVGPTGNFGVGSLAPAARLEAQVPSEETLTFRLLSGPNAFLDITPSGSVNTILSTVNNRNFILDPGTGSVGLGTSSPGARLDVVSPNIAARFRKGSATPAITSAVTQMDNSLTTGECAWMRNSSSSNSAPVIKIHRHPSSTGTFIEGWNWDGTNPAARMFNITGAGTFVAGSDFAETFALAEDEEPCEPGDVVVLAPHGGRVIQRTDEPYDSRLVGVYSTRPGILGAEKGGETRVDPGDIPVAVTGIVPTKVTCENGAIVPGDLLTTSHTPGYAMKASGTKMHGALVYPTGTILGKALNGLEEGAGVIEVMLMLR